MIFEFNDEPINIMPTGEISPDRHQIPFVAHSLPVDANDLHVEVEEALDQCLADTRCGACDKRFHGRLRRIKRPR